jgi:hypothetical protein
MDKGMVDVSIGASGVGMSGENGVVVEAALCSSRRVNNGGTLSRLDAEDSSSGGSAVGVSWYVKGLENPLEAEESSSS